MAESGWPSKQTLAKTAAVAAVVVSSAVAFALNFGPQGAHAVPYDSAVPLPPNAPRSAASSSDDASGEPSEDALLASARRALSENPERALAVAERMEALYPSGALVKEREETAIQALRQLGRTKDADDRASLLAHRLPEPGRDQPRGATGR